MDKSDLDDKIEEIWPKAYKDCNADNVYIRFPEGIVIAKPDVDKFCQFAGMVLSEFRSVDNQICAFFNNPNSGNTRSFVFKGSISTGTHKELRG